MAERLDPAVEVIAGDPAAALQEPKRADGKDIWLCGGGKLAGALRTEIDELVVKLHPVAVGSGVPLFDAASSRSASSWSPATPAPAACCSSPIAIWGTWSIRARDVGTTIGIGRPVVGRLGAGPE